MTDAAAGFDNRIGEKHIITIVIDRGLAFRLNLAQLLSINFVRTRRTPRLNKSPGLQVLGAWNSYQVK